jgi:hypothetical protein
MEAWFGDPGDGGGGDVMVPAVFHEGAFEPGVTPQVTEPVELGAHDVDHGDPTDVVRYRRR